MKRLTVAEASKLWGVCVEIVRWWVEKGTLPPGYAGKMFKGKQRNTYYIWELDK